MLNGRQVRACVDCGWNMTTEEISANALCDLGLFRAFHRAANSGFASPDSVSDLTTSSTSPSSRWMSPLMFDPSVDDSGDGARSWLSEHKSELLAVQDSPSLLFVTTESAAAGKSIKASLQSRYPSLRVVSSEKGNDLSSAQFIHSADGESNSDSFKLHRNNHLRHQEKQEGARSDNSSLNNRNSSVTSTSKRLKPVLNWWLLGEFEFIAGCGTTFSITATARRSLLPSSFVVHEHRPPPPSLWRQPGEKDAQLHPADEVSADPADPAAAAAAAAVTIGSEYDNHNKGEAMAVGSSGGETSGEQGMAFQRPDGNIMDFFLFLKHSITATARRWLLPSSFVVHEHRPPLQSLWKQPGETEVQLHQAHGVSAATAPNLAVKGGTENANEQLRQQGRAIHHPDGNIMNLYPGEWVGCLSIEVIGRRWLLA